MMALILVAFRQTLPLVVDRSLDLRILELRCTERIGPFDRSLMTLPVLHGFTVRGRVPTVPEPGASRQF